MQLFYEQPENIDVEMKKGSMLQLLGKQTREALPAATHSDINMVGKCLSKYVGFAALIGGISRLWHCQPRSPCQVVHELDGLSDIGEATFVAFVNGNQRVKVKGKWTKVPLEEAVLDKDPTKWMVEINSRGAEDMVDKKQYGTFAKIACSNWYTNNRQLHGVGGPSGWKSCSF